MKKHVNASQRLNEHHVNKQEVKVVSREVPSSFISLRTLSFSELCDHVASRSRLTLGEEWLDHVLGNGLHAGYPLMLVAMKERDLVDLLLHVMLQFWKQHPNGLVYIMDGNRHVRPEMIEEALRRTGQMDQVQWEEQTAWFLPNSYLEATVMLDRITEIIVNQRNESTSTESLLRPPVLFVCHQIASMIIMSEDKALSRVDAFFHQLSRMAFQHELHVVTTNLIDYMDLLFGENEPLDDEEWHWYQHYLQQQQQQEHQHDQHDEKYDIPDPWSMAFHQLAERELLARIPHHLYLLVDNVTGARYGILKEQHVTIGKGLIRIRHAEGVK